MSHPDTTHTRFRAIAQRRPDLVALAGDTGRLTYGELDRWSDDVADTLRRNGCVPGEPVAVLLARSAAHVAAILGGWKFGSACVPVDAGLPADQVLRLLDAAGAGAVIDVDGTRRRAGGRVPFPEPAAYVFFTSGSTGEPKAVAIPHTGIVNEADWTRAEYALGEDDRGTWLSSPQFAISRWELWPHLTTGASVLVARQDLSLDAGTVQQWLLDQAATTTILVTGLGERLLGLDWPADTALRLMIVGGEQLRRWPGAVPFSVVNSYGATETSGVRLTSTLPPSGNGFPPIGTPIANTTVHVLDEHGAEAVEGELYVGGHGLALGYVGNPELTAERFVPDPFAGGTARMYRTGDLVRRTPGGAIAYVGRVGADPKVGGARVDLAAVEAALMAHPAVVFAAAAVTEGELVAYLGLREDVTPHAMRAVLVDRLPRHAVPTRFLRLAAQPTLVSGKLDRAGLPAPASLVGLTDPLLSPRDEVERRVHRVFGEVLGGGGVDFGVLDDFFAVGGDSIALVRLRQLLATEFGRDLTQADIYSRRTVADVAALLAKAPEAVDTVDSLAAPGHDAVIALSGIQRGLWLHEQNNLTGSAYLETISVTVDGPLDLEELRRAIADVVAGQDLLRASMRPGDMTMVVAPTTCVVLPVVDDTPDPGLTAPFDLTRGPLFRLRLRRLAADRHELVLVVHHLVWDGASAEVWLSELVAAYDRVARPRPPGYRPAEHHETAAAVEHWRARLAGAPSASPAFAARTGESTLGVVARPLPFSGDLLAAAARAGCSVLALGAAAFAAALRASGGGDDQVFLTPVSVRDVRSARTIGPHFTMVPLRVRLSGEPTGATVLTEAASAIESALPHSTVPFDAVMRALAPRRERGEVPFGQFLFEVNRLPSTRSTAGGTTWRLRWSPSLAAKFRLSLSWNDDGDGWTQRLEHDTAHVSENQAQRFLDEVERHALRLAGDLDAVFSVPVETSARAEESAPPVVATAVPGVLRGFIAELWRDTLEIDQVLDEDNFVELGGHSLAAVRIVLAIAEEHGTRLPTQLIFECDCFAEFVRHVARALDEGQALDA